MTGYVETVIQIFVSETDGLGRRVDVDIVQFVALARLGHPAGSR